MYEEPFKLTTLFWFDRENKGSLEKVKVHLYSPRVVGVSFPSKICEIRNESWSRASIIRRFTQIHGSEGGLCDVDLASEKIFNFMDLCLCKKNNELLSRLIGFLLRNNIQKILHVKREHTNKFDPNAIIVLVKIEDDFLDIGYIPKVHAEKLVATPSSTLTLIPIGFKLERMSLRLVFFVREVIFLEDSKNILDLSGNIVNKVTTKKLQEEFMKASFLSLKKLRSMLEV